MIWIIPIAPVFSENFKMIRLTGTVKIGSFHMNVSITSAASRAGSSASSIIITWFRVEVGINKHE